MGNGCTLDCTYRKGTEEPADGPLSDESDLLQRVDVDGLVRRSEISEFAALWCDQAAAGRMLRATEGDVDLAVHKMVEALKWRDRNQHILEGNVKLSGDNRCVGLDAHGNSIWYACQANQILTCPPCIDEITCEFERMLTLLDLQGHGGRVVCVHDVFGFDVWKNLNITRLIDIAAALNSYFADRLEKYIIVDIPKGAMFCWRASKPVLPPKTRNKFVFVDQKGCLELLAELCHGAAGSLSMMTFARVRDAMSLNRTKESTVEHRRLTWHSTTWCGDGALVPSTKSTSTVGGALRHKQLLAAFMRMETNRVRRNGVQIQQVLAVADSQSKLVGRSSCSCLVVAVVICMLAALCAQVGACWLA